MLYSHTHVSFTSSYFDLKTVKDLNLAAHLHQTFEMIAVLQGEMTVQIDGKREHITTGEAVLIFPYQVHSVESEACVCRLCSFSRFIPISFSTRKNNQYPTSNRFVMPPLLTELFLHAQNSDAYYAHKGLLYLLIDVFNKDRRYLPRTSAASSLTSKILIYVESNFESTCDLKSLSAALGYDPDYLSLVFKKTVGMNFTYYVNLYRLQKACYLLECSEFSILRCAEESGFSCLRSFNRNFKAHFGHTPKEHRALYQK